MRTIEYAYWLVQYRQSLFLYSEARNIKQTPKNKFGNSSYKTTDQDNFKVETIFVY